MNYLHTLFLSLLMVNNCLYASARKQLMSNYKFSMVPRFLNKAVLDEDDDAMPLHPLRLYGTLYAVLDDIENHHAYEIPLGTFSYKDPAQVSELDTNGDYDHNLEYVDNDSNICELALKKLPKDIKSVFEYYLQLCSSKAERDKNKVLVNFINQYNPHRSVPLQPLPRRLAQRRKKAFSESEKDNKTK